MADLDRQVAALDKPKANAAQAQGADREHEREMLRVMQVAGTPLPPREIAQPARHGAEDRVPLARRREASRLRRAGRRGALPRRGGGADPLAILAPPTVVILTFGTRCNSRSPYAARRLNLRKKADVIIVRPVRQKLRRRRTAQTFARDARVESTSYFWNSTRGDGKVPGMGREATRNDTWRRKLPQPGGCVQKVSEMLAARSRKPFGRPLFRRCSSQVTGGSK